MKNVSAALALHIQEGVTTLCRCLEINRRDGKSFHFTDHDEDLIVENTLYTSYNSFAGTSVSQPIDTEIDAVTINGILTSSAIFRDDVAAGLFDFAESRFFVVNYADPAMGKIILRVGWLGECILNEDQSFSFELRGLGQMFATRLGKVYSPTCRTDLGSHFCKIPLRPKIWLPNNDYFIGDTIVGHVNAATENFDAGLVNPSFENDGQVANLHDPTGWTTYGNQYSTWSTYSTYGGTLNAPDFTYFLVQAETVLGQTEIGAYQDCDLVAAGVSTAEIDAGQARCYVGGWIGRLEKEASGRIRIFYMDSTGLNPALLWDSGLLAPPLKTFKKVIQNDINIPAGTRFLRFDIFGLKSSGSLIGAIFDGLELQINHGAGTFGNEAVHGNIALKCTHTGTSGTTEPSFTNHAGDTYTDGTATWLAVGRYLSIAHVASVVDNQTFEADFLTPMSATLTDGTYDGGLVYWETGPNAGKVAEIKSQIGKNITTFLRFRHTPVIGDRFIALPGCDKRMVTCVNKFNNAENFRGEPNVPGQDQYQLTPNAGGGFYYNVSSTSGGTGGTNG